MTISVTDIFEKYTAVQKSVEDTRRLVQQRRSELESIHDSTHALREQQTSMQTIIDKARHDSAEWSSKLHEISQQQKQVEDELSQTKAERNGILQKMVIAKRFAEEQRRDFLDTCREFRLACKRMRLSEQPDENLRTFLEFHNVIVEEDSGAAYSMEGDNTIDSNNNKNDSELELAMDTARQCRQERLEAEAVLQKALEEQGVDRDRTEQRSKQVTLQRNQLQRIQNDTIAMEKELTNLLRQTRRMQEMGQGFQKNAIARRKQRDGVQATAAGQHRMGSHAAAVTPSPRTVPANSTSMPRNPYAKRSTRRNNKSAGKQACSKAATNAERISALEQQHPHRAGRIRVDPQFSCALEIGSTSRRDDHGYEKHQAPDDSFELASVASSTSSEQREASLEPTSLAARLDEPDDDDDELLSFQAFSK